MHPSARIFFHRLDKRCCERASTCTFPQFSRCSLVDYFDVVPTYFTLGFIQSIDWGYISLHPGFRSGAHPRQAFSHVCAFQVVSLCVYSRTQQKAASDAAMRHPRAQRAKPRHLLKPWLARITSTAASARRPVLTCNNNNYLFPPVQISTFNVALAFPFFLLFFSSKQFLLLAQYTQQHLYTIHYQ